jgi:hypothetical protein
MVNNFLEQCHQLIHKKGKEQEGSHRIAAEIISGMIRGSKNWTLAMVCKGHLPFINESSLASASSCKT